MRLRILCAAALLASQTHAAAGPTTSLEWVLSQVEQSNPEVKAARAEIGMAQGMAQAAYGWMPPRLSLEQMGMTWPSPDASMWMERRYTLTQELPFPGRTWLAGRTASHGAERVKAMARMTLEQKLFEAREAFYQLAAAERVLAALEKTAEAVKDMARLSTRRGRFGQLDRMGQFMDVMLSMESSDVESMLPHWRQERLMAEARLNRLSGAPAERSLGVAGLAVEDLLKLPRPGAGQLWEALLKANPELEEAEHHVEHARTQKLFAQSGWLPDLMVQGALAEDPMGAQQSSAMLGLSLPFVWFWRQAGEAKAASAEHEHALLRLEALRLKLQEEARSAVGELESTLESLRLTWTRTLPAAEEGLRQARSGFQTTALGPSEVIMAVQDYRMTEEKLAALILRAGRSQAMLEMLTATRSLPAGAPTSERHHD